MNNLDNFTTKTQKPKNPKHPNQDELARVFLYDELKWRGMGIMQ
jgi:hypothetical protein